jgi:hypothetical protein
MIRSRTGLALFLAFCVIVLLPRLGGPHLHICLDGSAPAVALHISDGNDSDLIFGGDDSHQDQKVDVANPVLGKLLSPSLGAGLFLIVLLCFVTACQRYLLPVLRAMAVPDSPLFLRPPLRGPPA